jgi:hypothetical protein
MQRTQNGRKKTHRWKTSNKKINIINKRINFPKQDKDFIGWLGIGGRNLNQRQNSKFAMKEYNSDGKSFNDKNQVSVGGINISRNSWMEQMEQNITPTPVLCISAKGCCKKIKERKIHRTDNKSARKSEGDGPGLMAKIA